MRVPAWNEALAALFAEAAARRFRWGYHDCCQFVARGAEAATGLDRRDLFSRYRTRREAELILAAHGGFEGLLTHAFGEPVHPSRASAGDVVLINMGRNGVQPALCMGLYSYAPGRVRLENRLTREALKAWLT